MLYKVAIIGSVDILLIILSYICLLLLSNAFFSLNCYFKSVIMEMEFDSNGQKDSI